MINESSPPVIQLVKYFAYLSAPSFCRSDRVTGGYANNSICLIPYQPSYPLGTPFFLPCSHPRIPRDNYPGNFRGELQGGNFQFIFTWVLPPWHFFPSDVINTFASIYFHPGITPLTLFSLWRHKYIWRHLLPFQKNFLFVLLFTLGFSVFNIPCNFLQ